MATKTNKAKHFYTNGIIDRKFSECDEIPDGFRRGRTNGCVAFTTGLIAINNGEICKFIEPDKPIPDGFVRGQLKHSAEHNRKISLALKGKERSPEHCKNLSISHQSESYKNQIKSTLLEKYGVENAFNLEKVKQRNNSPEACKKRFSTMKKNNTIKKSKLEDRYYEFYCSKFGKNDVHRQYRSNYYPFASDFYIESINLYIEINGFWTHGKHPYDENNSEDVEQLNNWIKLSETSKFYLNAIENWSKRDVKKLNCFIENNLNYLIIYYSGVVFSNLNENEYAEFILKD